MQTTKITKKQAAENDRQAALTELRRLYPAGSTVYTILRHVSQSGMSRTFSVVHHDDENGISDISWLIARAGIAKRDTRRGGLVMGGCGMDMGYALAYSLSRALYPDGHACTGNPGSHYRDNRCPSNDHTNDYTMPFNSVTVWHGNGGYALRHRHV